MVDVVDTPFHILSENEIIYLGEPRPVSLEVRQLLRDAMCEYLVAFPRETFPEKEKPWWVDCPWKIRDRIATGKPYLKTDAPKLTKRGRLLTPGTDGVETCKDCIGCNGECPHSFKPLVESRRDVADDEPIMVCEGGVTKVNRKVAISALTKLANIIDKMDAEEDCA